MSVSYTSYRYITQFCDLAAIFLTVGIIVYLCIRSGRKRPARTYLAAMLPVLILMALTDLYQNTPFLDDVFVSMTAINFSYILVFLCLQLLSMFFLMDLLAETGRKDAIKRYSLLIWLPFVLSCVLLGIKLWLDARNGNLGFYSIRFGPLTLPIMVLYLIPAGYLAVSMAVLWRKNRQLVLFFSLLLLTWIILIQNFRQVSLGPLMAVLTLFLYYFLPKKNGILFQIGSILVLLMVMAVTIVDNYISASAFSSRIESMQELYTARLKEISTMLSGISAWPWFVDYWLANPESILPGDASAEALDERLAPVIQELDLDPDEGLDVILEISQKEAARLSEESQHIIANVFYDYLYQYMRGLFDPKRMLEISMLKPGTDGLGVVLVQEMSWESPDSYSLGLDIGMEFYSSAWGNTEHVSNWISDWGWHEKESEGLLGYQLEIEGGSSGEPLILTTLVFMDEALTPLSYMRFFRIRATFYMALIAGIILFLLYTSVLRPIALLRKSIVFYQDEKDSEAVRRDLSALKLENEIGDMARQFTDLAEEMDHYTHEIVEMAEAQEQIHTELSLAENIQRNALSRDFPDEPAFSLFASMTAAKEVGGDFYDFVRIDEDHLALVIADVSGKGIPAALFMMSVMIMISDRALMGGSPGEILTAVNNQISKNNTVTNMFVTVWLGILDLRTGQMACSNAGHEYPFLRGKDGHFSLYKDKHGLVIGAYEGIRYRDYTVTLPPGGAVFVYTDGIPEACTESGAFYGTERLALTLSSVAPDESAEGILASVQKSVDEFTAGVEQFDDMTMLCLIYHGPGKTP